MATEKDLMSYNPAGGAHASKDFIFSGHQYLAGEAFPLDEVTDEKAKMMISAGKIGLGKPNKHLVARLASRVDEVKARDKAEADRAKRKIERKKERELAAKEDAELAAKRAAREAAKNPPRSSSHARL